MSYMKRYIENLAQKYVDSHPNLELGDVIEMICNGKLTDKDLEKYNEEIAE